MFRKEQSTLSFRSINSTPFLIPEIVLMSVSTDSNICLQVFRIAGFSDLRPKNSYVELSVLSSPSVWIGFGVLERSSLIKTKKSARENLKLWEQWR